MTETTADSPGVSQETPSPQTLPNRRAAKDALRTAGFSARQVDALLRAGWRGLVSERDAEHAELQDAVEAMTERLAKNV